MMGYVKRIFLLLFGLLTDGGDGPNRRLRVDVGQTGFFAGKEFRIFKEWTSATSGTYIIKVVVPINVILLELFQELDQGSMKLDVMIGGTEGGTFSETFTNYSANNMTEKPQPPYVSQLTITAGGTHTGGTLIDRYRMKAASNINFASSVGGVGSQPRGIGPGTYYMHFTLTDVIGIFKMRWEERA